MDAENNFEHVKDEKLWRALSALNITIEARTIGELEFKKRLVLDPLAGQELKPDDFDDIEELVIGGILDDEKFTGKTKSLISDRLQCDIRHLGRK